MYVFTFHKQYFFYSNPLKIKKFKIENLVPKSKKTRTSRLSKFKFSGCHAFVFVFLPLIDSNHHKKVRKTYLEAKFQNSEGTLFS